MYGILEYCGKGDLRHFLQTTQASPAIRTNIEVSSILDGYLKISEIPQPNYVKTLENIL